MNQILATLPTLSMWFQCGATFKATFLYQAGFHVTDWIVLNFDSLYQSAPNNDNTEEATAKNFIGWKRRENDKTSQWEVKWIIRFLWWKTCGTCLSSKTEEKQSGSSDGNNLILKKEKST